MGLIPYIIGSLLVLGAACYGAILMGMPQAWVIVLGAVILGRAIIGATNSGASSSEIGKSGPSTGIKRFH